MTTPADPRSDQNARRLQDLYRLRELLRLHGRNGELHIPSLPQPERAEAEEILDRIGELDSSRQDQRQTILLNVASAEAYLDDLAGNPENADEVRRLRQEFSQLRSMLTGLPPDPEGSQS